MLRNVALRPTFVVSNFATNPPEADVWDYTRWVFADNENLADPIIDIRYTDHQTIFRVDAGVFEAGKIYYMATEHAGKVLGPSGLSPVLAFQTRPTNFLNELVVSEIELEEVFMNMEMHDDELGVS